MRLFLFLVATWLLLVQVLSVVDEETIVGLESGAIPMAKRFKGTVEIIAEQVDKVRKKGRKEGRNERNDMKNGEHVIYLLFIISIMYI